MGRVNCLRRLIEIHFHLGYNLLSYQPQIGEEIYWKMENTNAPAASQLSLTELPIGQDARVTAVVGNSGITRRLMEMGVVPGVEVRVIKAAPFGDPIEVRLRGYSLAMRRSEADAIEVTM